MAIQLYAQPYDLSATGFYFESYEEYQEKSEALTNNYGATVEEFEIQFIDGEEWELFKACGINQSNLDEWFDIIDGIDENDKAELFYRCEDLGQSLQEAQEELGQTGWIYQGDKVSQCEDYADETGMLDGLPENLRFYFDFEAMARDCENNGEINEFEFQGTTYTAVAFN